MADLRNMEKRVNTTPVPPPGFYIREELEERGWSQRDLAFVLGCPEQAVNMIISGKRGISPEMAKALGDVFDVPAEFFANLQSIYDLAKARDPDPGVARRARLQDRYPVREMIKRGWLEETDATLLEVQMTRFFECSDPEEIPHMPHAGYKSHYDETPPPQLAWLFRVRQIAKSIAAVKYTEKMLREAIQRLRSLAYEPDEIRHVPRILMECGVRFILVEPLPSSKIDGVCVWLDDRSPVIGISTRLDRIDNFWFVLPHEIEHVLSGHGQSRGEIIDAELEGERASSETTVSEEERTANRAAADFCVSDAELDSFIARKHPYISERDIVGFAHRLQVHPGIVVGRYQYRTGRYDFLRKYQVRIRQFLIDGGALVDGWGHIAPVSI